MREIMDEGKILIANLSKGRIGEDNSRLLGALLITKLQLAAMSRVDIPEEKRRDFFLYVDEFQNFATEAFCNILSEARKYRLSLVLANQYLAQLEEMTPTGKTTRVRDAIFGNVGTMIVFRVGAEDAEFLEREFQPEFTADDLTNLAKYHVCIKLMIDGVAGAPFSAITLPKIEKPQKSYRETIIRISRERWATPKKIIEEKIEKWAGTQTQVVFPQKQVLYNAQCSRCQKKVKVPFLPDPSRPVYCKSCLKKIEKEKTISLASLKPRNEKPKEKKEPDPEEIKKVLEKILKNEKSE
jgi:CxxC-x17-CxxC domain-containing protein